MAKAKKIPLIEDFNHIPVESLVPEEEQPYPLPEHWKWVRLGTTVKNITVKTESFDAADKYLGLEDLNTGGGILRISDTHDLKSAKTVFQYGDVLYGKLRPYLNKHAVASFSGVCSTDILALRPEKIIDAAYLDFWLSTPFFLNAAITNSKGVNLPRVSFNSIAQYPFPLPPIEEQKQIVAYLDEKLGKIDSVHDKLQDFLDHAAQRKDNLIQAGVTGHLTEKWREKNQDCSRTMFTNEELQQVSVPETWKWLPLGDVATILNGDRGKNYAGRSTWIDSGIPFVNAGTLQNSVLTEEGMNYISKETYSNLNGGKLRPGDILFCLRGSLGKCALNTSYQEGAIGSSIAIIRSGDSANPRFSFYYFLSPISQIMIDEFDNGSAQPNLSAKSLKLFKVPLPPLGEQKEIARILDEQLERIERTDKLVAEVLERLDTMKQQIVSAALAGRLSLQVS